MLYNPKKGGYILGKKKDTLKSITDDIADNSKLENKTGQEEKKADDYAEKPEVDPEIDYMRWSD